MIRGIIALALLGSAGVLIATRPLCHGPDSGGGGCCGSGKSCGTEASAGTRGSSLPFAEAADEQPAKVEAGFLGGYFKIWKALGNDELKGVAAAKDELAAALARASKAPPAILGEKERDLRARLLAAARAEALKVDALDLKKARESFGTLSLELRKLIDAFPADADAYVVYCDMAKKSWLQDGPKVLNPYYGASMAACGRVVHKPKDPAPKSGAGTLPAGAGK